jgi:hypothetical protein
MVSGVGRAFSARRAITMSALFCQFNQWKGQKATLERTMQFGSEGGQRRVQEIERMTQIGSEEEEREKEGRRQLHAEDKAAEMIAIEMEGGELAAEEDELDEGEVYRRTTV